MRVKLKLQSYDYLENKRTQLVDDVGIYTDDTLKYKEQDSIHVIQFMANEVYIERKGDVTTNLHLHGLHESKAIVHSEFGDMELITKTYKIQKDENVWVVEYAIFNGDEMVLHQQMEWEFTPLT